MNSGSALRITIAAGRHAFFEYQYQLQSDWTAEADSLVPLAGVCENWVRRHIHLILTYGCAQRFGHATRARVAPFPESAMAVEAVDSVSLSANAVSVSGNTLRVSTHQLNPATASLPVVSSAAFGSNQFPVFFSKKVGATGLLFLDLRFQVSPFSFLCAVRSILQFG